jgi:hypothetical protein
MKMKRPPSVRDDIYAAIEGGEGGEGGEMGMENYAAQPQGPSFGPSAASARRVRPGMPYETGEPTVDGFNRQRTGEGPAQDEAFPGVFEDPAEHDRMIQGAYQAGVNGDDDAIRPIIEGPYGQTPFGQMLKKAYMEGRMKREAARGRR